MSLWLGCLVRPSLILTYLMKRLSFLDRTNLRSILWIAIAIFLFLLPQQTVAQEVNYPTFNYWGIFQPRLSYGSMEDSTSTQNRFEHGIRRARFRLEIGLMEKLEVRYDADFASGTFQSVDLFVMSRLNEKWTLRAGIMASAQPRAHIFTLLPFIDGYDRAAVAEQWAGMTLGGGGRDFGVDLRYETPEWTVVGFLHNGDGSFDRRRSNFAQTLSSESTTRGVDRTVMATSIFVAHRFQSLPGVEIGGYLSQNPRKNPNTAGASGEGREYTSYAAHVYYGAIPGSQPVRLKFDLIGIDFQGDEDQQYLGASILGAVGLNEYMEFFARYENIQRDTNLDGNNFFNAGLTFSLSKLKGGAYATHRATLGYGLLDAADGNQQHQVVLQWHFVL